MIILCRLIAGDSDVFQCTNVSKMPFCEIDQFYHLIVTDTGRVVEGKQAVVH